MKKIYLLTLGCPRNLIDSETLSSLLKKKGFLPVDSPDNADIAIVNTCGFIRDAKDESIEMILRLAELKRSKKIKILIVTGCLSQRYPFELNKEIPEIDGVFGTSDFKDIPEKLEKLLLGQKVVKISKNPKFLFDEESGRDMLTPSHYAYLKTQEGCSNLCSYCVIPSLRGPLTSKSIDSILREADGLLNKNNVKELILVAQDLTVFGYDRNGIGQLPELLTKLSPIAGENKWLRLLYCHPAHFTDALIDSISSLPNVLKYIDLPIQHINDRILGAMNRGVTKKEIINLIARIRKNIPEAVIRTSIIVGFPGETEEEIKELLDFMAEIKFERLGTFMFSREEGTPAYSLPRHVPDSVKQERFNRVMELQQEISADNNIKYFNKTFKVLIDESSPEEGFYLGRSYMDAPEVDGVVNIKGAGLKVGEFHNIKITGTMEYDLEGIPK
ncbi:MAG: 30S ribosomal protein S12 methylthiotransferase RimO [Candidatus Omnitrophica bacterium]|nr:30S ribosomal protein S12 methylthiotransferase RimO [Candidatus Omnitrophota bacterium]